MKISIDEFDLSNFVELPTGTHYVYLIFGSSGLRYIGVTSSLYTRLGRHKAHSECFRVFIRRYESRAEAEVDEANLIRKYKPPYNSKHTNQNPTPNIKVDLKALGLE